MYKRQDHCLIWVYGLNCWDDKGDFIKKNMCDCTGIELAAEWLYHIGIPEDQIMDLATNECNTTPCMMPYVTTFFEPRAEGDRPKVVPDGSVNLAFVGQFADTPRDTVFTTEEALKTANELGYPVLLRPSYVLGGQNMIIAHCDSDVTEYMTIITSHKLENPVLIDKYMMGTEVEVDAICDGEDFLIPGIMEHIERAGIHSGDSISIYPAQTLTEHIKRVIIDYTEKLAKALHVVGLVNIQYVVYNHEVFVIEVNPRSSRTVPYISKVTGVPMVDVAARVMLGTPLKDLGYGTGLHPIPPYYAVKVPVFSFEKLGDVNACLLYTSPSPRD